MPTQGALEITTVPRLHVITPDLAGPAALEAVTVAAGAGAPLVQVRTKTGTDRQRLSGARDAVTASHAAGSLALINDRVDLSLAAGADGAHVGDDDLPISDARRLLGPTALLGATARGPEAARAAEAAGADYVGVGPVYATTTKEGLPAPLGPGGVAAVAAAVTIPVLAVSGMTAARVPEVLDAGAHGVAVVGAVFSAADPAGAMVELLDALAVPR